MIRTASRSRYDVGVILPIAAVVCRVHWVAGLHIHVQGKILTQRNHSSTKNSGPKVAGTEAADNSSVTSAATVTGTGTSSSVSLRCLNRQGLPLQSPLDVPYYAGSLSTKERTKHLIGIVDVTLDKFHREGRGETK